jgi:tripartite-type tricarboxylate transporter receptor subunit TctC
MAPAGTPTQVLEKIAAQVRKATRDPKIVEQFNTFGVDPVGNSPSEFSTMIATDIELWARAVKIAGLKAK